MPSRYLIVAVLLVAICLGALVFYEWQGRQIGQLGENTYVFLEIWQHTNGELIEGEYAPGMCIDFPGYDFYENAGVLSIFTPLAEVPDDFLTVVGVGESLSGSVGMGAASGLVWINSFPTTVGAVGDNFSMTSLDADGTVSLTYRGINLVLEPGEWWENVTISTEQTGENSLVKYTTMVTVKNYGFQDKNKIKVY